MILVTKPFLPPIEKYQNYLEGIWSRNWLTNNGPLVNELELRLKDYLQLPHMLFLNNGTIAIQLAIKALNLSGEIITTPFSFVATTSSILWENCKPVFVDIDEHSLNIDPKKIEAAITKDTTAILATHVYGNPCEIDQIEAIATKHSLKVIYDAAHCFGTLYKGRSVFNYGDISITSFHATKLFHTIEGGAVFTNDAALLKKIAFMRNFGHNGPDDFAEIGINGKNSEFHAAMGLTNLDYISEIMATRKWQCEKYSNLLLNKGVRTISLNRDAVFNNAYFPVIFENEKTLLNVMEALELNNIHTRRYFYPSLNTIKIFADVPMPVSEDIAVRVLSLPLYHTLSAEEIDFVCRIIIRTLRHGL